MGMRERASDNAHSLWIYFTFQFSEFSLMFQLLSKYLFPPLWWFFFARSLSHVCRHLWNIDIDLKRFVAISSLLLLLFYVSLSFFPRHFTIFAYLSYHKLLNKMNACLFFHLDLQLLPIKIYEMWEIERTKIKLLQREMKNSTLTKCAERI